MTVGLIAFHYPRADRIDEFVARTQCAVELLRRTAGCLTADCWITRSRDAVVTTGQWDSEAAQSKSFATAAAAGADFDFDERETRPRDVIWLTSPSQDEPAVQP